MDSGDTSGIGGGEMEAFPDLSFSSRCFRRASSIKLTILSCLLMTNNTTMDIRQKLVKKL